MRKRRQRRRWDAPSCNRHPIASNEQILSAYIFILYIYPTTRRFTDSNFHAPAIAVELLSPVCARDTVVLDRVDSRAEQSAIYNSVPFSHVQDFSRENCDSILHACPLVRVKSITCSIPETSTNHVVQVWSGTSVPAVIVSCPAYSRNLLDSVATTSIYG